MFKSGQELLESGCNFAVTEDGKFFIMAVMNNTVVLETSGGLLKIDISAVTNAEKIGGKMY